MTHSFRGILSTCALAVAMSASAQANVVFSNFAGTSPLYDMGNANLVADFGPGALYAQGETFTPGATESLTQLQLGLGCFSTCTGTDIYRVALTSDGGNQPGAVIESFTFDGTALTTFGVNLVPITFTSILHPALAAGKQFWVTVAPVSAGAAAIGWNENTTGDPAPNANSIDGGVTWLSPSGATPGAFEVDGAVPEPGSLLLLSSGILAGLVLRSRRRG
jgi:hypothetical protein